MLDNNKFHTVKLQSRRYIGALICGDDVRANIYQQRSPFFIFNKIFVAMHLWICVFLHLWHLILLVAGCLTGWSFWQPKHLCVCYNRYYWLLVEFLATQRFVFVFVFLCLYLYLLCICHNWYCWLFGWVEFLAAKTFMSSKQSATTEKCFDMKGKVKALWLLFSYKRVNMKLICAYLANLYQPSFMSCVHTEIYDHEHAYSYVSSELRQSLSHGPLPPPSTSLRKVLSCPVHVAIILAGGQQGCQSQSNPKWKTHIWSALLSRVPAWKKRSAFNHNNDDLKQRGLGRFL